MGDVITIEGLETRCLIGIHATERLFPQFVSARLSIELDGSTAAHSGRLADTIDYSLVSAVVRFVLASGRFFLIETAVEVASAAILGAAAAVQPKSVTVELAKPAALPAAASVCYRAQRHAFPLTWQEHAGGRYCVLFNAPSCRLLRVELVAGGRVPASWLQSAATAILSLHDGIKCLPGGSAWLSGLQQAQDELVNVSGEPCSLLLLVPQRGAEQGAPLPTGTVDFFARAGHYIVKAGS